jgi:hypothetical protein
MHPGSKPPNSSAKEPKKGGTPTRTIHNEHMWNQSCARETEYEVSNREGSSQPLVKLHRSETFIVPLPLPIQSSLHRQIKR